MTANNEWNEKLQQYCLPDLDNQIPSIKVQITTELHYFEPFRVLINEQCATVPVATYKHSDGDWMVSLKADDFFKIIKETKRVNTVFCPSCNSPHIWKNGFGKKGDRAYMCKEPFCGKTWISKEK